MEEVDEAVDGEESELDWFEDSVDVTPQGGDAAPKDGGVGGFAHGG